MPESLRGATWRGHNMISFVTNFDPASEREDHADGPALLGRALPWPERAVHDGDRRRRDRSRRPTDFGHRGRLRGVRGVGRRRVERAASNPMTGQAILPAAGGQVDPRAEPDRRLELERIFGDEAAFRAWYEVAARRLYAYLFGRCGGDPSLAEDLTQQAFLQAVRHRDVSTAGRTRSPGSSRSAATG